jgi:hypothetical protein
MLERSKTMDDNTEKYLFYVVYEDKDGKIIEIKGINIRDGVNVDREKCVIIYKDKKKDKKKDTA